METVYDDQRKLLTELSNAIRNYRADGKERKKELSYYAKKLQKLDEIWAKFEKNDSTIRDDPELDMSQEYFTQDTYDRAKKIYEDQREVIVNGERALKTKIEEKELEKNSAASSVTKKTVFTDFNDLFDEQSDNENVNLRGDGIHDDDEIGDENEGESAPDVVRVYFFMAKELKSAINTAEKINSHESQGIANAQLENLKTVWSEFRIAHRELSVSEHKKHCVNISDFQSRYLNIIGKLNDLVNGGSSKQSVQLPKIKLPEFDGEQSKWRAFKDLFDKIVHSNVTISESIKVQYLKSNLTGKAAKMVEHLPPTDKSYKKCYELLCNRYDNERETVSILIDEILNIDEQKFESGNGLKVMHDKTYECIMSIESMGTSVENWDLLLIQILMRKLNRETILDYEKQLTNVKKNQTLASFLQYLERRFLALMSAEAKVKNHVNKNKNLNAAPVTNNNQKKDVPFQCTYCEKNHSIYKCDVFVKLDPSKRFSWARENKICYVCLQKHARNECKSKFDCKICEKKHNVLLHLEKKAETKSLMATAVETEEITASVAGESNVNTLLAATRDEDNLLATAMVRVLASNGEKILVKAVIDMGSQSAMINESTRQALALKTERASTGVDGIESMTTTPERSVVLKIFPRFSDEFVLTTRALVMKKITSLNVFKDGLEPYGHLHNLKYADPTVNSDEPIDVLLNVADYARITKSGLIKGAPDEPIAQNTEFGWIIFGPNGARNKNVIVDIQKKISTTALISNVEIEKKITNLFETPEIDDDSEAENDMTEEEKACEEYFLRTTKRDASGKFIVSMPFKNNTEPVLGDSKKAALAVFFQLEKRFVANPKLKEQYSEAIRDAIERGHLVRVERTLKNSHYIPHHAVFKNSTTTKLRTVYNASQRTSNGKSLNEQLAIGKMSQPTILDLMLRWRTFKVALIADIEKMFKQIKLDENQQHLQLILWRDDSGKIQEYKMTTVTFGLANSPYLAIRWLKAVADAVEEKFPLAAAAIRENFYVDDCTGGAFSIMEAWELYEQLKEAFNSVGCNLRKFVSNSTEIMQRIPEEDREKIESTFIKVLGVHWNPVRDIITFKINFDAKTVPKTKRNLVAEIATIYDPLGLIAPIVVKAKILLQRVWTLSTKTKKYDWDDELPKEYIDEWLKIKSRSCALNSLSIQRFMQTEKNSVIHIHGFCDASEKAYAACVYIRAVNKNVITSTLLVAKSKNAPQQTIPKLELCGAKLLTQLIKKVRKAIKVNVDQVHLWCDSKCVLGWIASNPQRYKKYVSTRIMAIQKLKNVKWHHIPGHLNPADCASRGLYGDELNEHNLWWNGPPNLVQCVNFDENSIEKYDTENELKLNKISVLMSTKAVEFLPRAKSFYNLKKTFAMVLRFVNNCRSHEKTTGQVSLREMRQATTTIIKIVQREEFENEIQCLENVKKLNAKSKLFKLNVFLDDAGILRVGGRLKNSSIPFEAKYPIVLPKKNSLTDLIINEMHRAMLHGGAKLTESTIRQRYWPINSQSTIKRVLKNCIICAKIAPKPMSQLMADLPKYRVNQPFKVFLNTAIDFAGPFTTKTSSLRNCKIEKTYVCVFICMATKAVHLELVGSLNAESAIAAIRRFIGRRGKVENIFSDNGTNFVAANRILHDVSNDEKCRFTDTFGEELLSNEIIWQFIPPGSPHHNGLAEAAVKSMKYHLKRVLGEKTLTFEEMYTLLHQIEAVLNSRPICAMSSDPNDTQALTPAHFLHMAPMELPPDSDLSDIKSNYMSRWQHTQKIFQNFWHQWKHDYLNQLQQRDKWCTRNHELEVNDLVMVKEEALPAARWRMARVIQKHPGHDGLTRVVTVKTGKNELKRTITKVAPLPLKANTFLVTALLCVSSLINTAKAHRFSLIENKQVAESNQNVNIEMKHADNFALFVVIAIFIICFFLFLMFLLRILYQGMSTSTQLEANSTHRQEETPNENTNSTTIKLQPSTMSKPNNIHNICVQSTTRNHVARMESNVMGTHNTFSSCLCSSAQIDNKQVEEYHTLNRIATPMPAKRNVYITENVSPLIKLEKEFYESRKASLSIYPNDDLSELREIMNK